MNCRRIVVTQRLEARLRDDREAAKLDNAMRGKLSEMHSKIIDTCLPEGQVRSRMRSRL